MATIRQTLFPVETQGDIEALEELFIDRLKDIYWVEQRLVRSLHQLAEAATCAVLQNTLVTYLVQARNHVGRVEDIFAHLKQKAVLNKCEVVEHLTKEAEMVIEETDANTPLRDEALARIAQKAAHYEIEAYGTLKVMAKALELKEAVELIDQTLAEEKQAGVELTQIVKDKIKLTWPNEDIIEERA